MLSIWNSGGVRNNMNPRRLVFVLPLLAVLLTTLLCVSALREHRRFVCPPDVIQMIGVKDGLITRRHRYKSPECSVLPLLYLVLRYITWCTSSRAGRS